MRHNWIGSIAVGALALGLTLAPAVAQQGVGPQPAPLPPPIATPQDTPYPGVVTLLVDSTDTAHRVLNVHETIPVSGSSIVLLYPQWIPGNHSPTGPIKLMGGLEITAGGQRIPWTRDRVNVFAFHVPLPDGTSQIEVNFQYLVPLRSTQGRVSFDSNLLDLSWNTVALYPAGHFSRDIQFAPSIQLPAGWHFATALTTGSQDGQLVHFENVPFNTLVDSPLYAGVNYRRIDLSTSADNQVHLNVFADTAAELAATPEQVQLHRNLAVQAQRLFHSHHYNHYDFLFILSNTIGGEGLEHHQSSEDATNGGYFISTAPGNFSDLLAHEYTHSWNGKFRRPYDLWTPNFNVPMQDDLLWVYEGLTQYYGYVLTARAGLRSPARAREIFATLAAGFADNHGRDWRPLVDTTNQPIMSTRSAVNWVSWLRAEDYYTESALIWLDADTTIRRLSDGSKSLDDFARSFYSVHNGSFVTDPYTFDDIVNALNQVQPYDWRTFLRSRIYELHPQVPEGGITQGGYRLIYNDTAAAGRGGPRGGRGGASFATSLGLTASPTGQLNAVWWGSPAFAAGLAPDMQILGVNGSAFSPAVLSDAILAAEHSSAPIELLVKNADAISTIALNYHGGLHIPHLERVAGTPDRLDAILAPKPQ
ncbi:MAG: M61 family metallopeptidase [Terriglobales bacterium]